MGWQVPRKATRGLVWDGFKTTRRCSPFATIVASIAEPVVVRSTAPAPSNRLASASIASPKVLTRSSSANRARRILGSSFCRLAAADRLMIGKPL
jgi:hypothetical protein